MYPNQHPNIPDCMIVSNCALCFVNTKVWQKKSYDEKARFQFDYMAPYSLSVLQFILKRSLPKSLQVYPSPANLI